LNSSFCWSSLTSAPPKMLRTFLRSAIAMYVLFVRWLAERVIITRKSAAVEVVFETYFFLGIYALTRHTDLGQTNKRR
jgi:hypothetical protein